MLNEEMRKSMVEHAMQAIASLANRINAAEMREILKDPENWEELKRSHGDNYYEELVLRSIRGLMPDEIIIVLELCYKKRLPSISKKDFANRIYYINETTPNGYKLPDTHRQKISEWAEAESEQPQQQENELPERVKKGLEDKELLKIFDNEEELKSYLFFCEKAENPTQMATEAVRLKLFKKCARKCLHTKLKELGYPVKTYYNWKAATSKAESMRDNK